MKPQYNLSLTAEELLLVRNLLARPADDLHWREREGALKKARAAIDIMIVLSKIQQGA